MTEDEKKRLEEIKANPIADGWLYNIDWLVQQLDRKIEALEVSYCNNHGLMDELARSEQELALLRKLMETYPIMNMIWEAFKAKQEPQ